MIKLFTRQQGYSTTKRNKSWDVAHVRTDHARGTAEGTVSAKFVMFCILGYVCTVPAVLLLSHFSFRAGRMIVWCSSSPRQVYLPRDEFAGVSAMMFSRPSLIYVPGWRLGLA